MNRLATWQDAYSGHYPTLASAVYLGQEEFLRHALDAYRAAQRELLPEHGQKWLDADASSWSTAEGFFDALVRQMAERLRRRAKLTGHLIEAEPDDGASDDNWPGEPSPSRTLGRCLIHPPENALSAVPADVQDPCTSTAVPSSVEDRL